MSSTDTIGLVKTTRSEVAGMKYPPFDRSPCAWAKRFTYAGLSFGGFITVVALQAINYRNGGSGNVAGVLLPLAAGACLQNAAQTIHPGWGITEKTFLADYAAPVFLVISQVYNNLANPSSDVQEGVFSALTILGGACVASFVHTLFACHFNRNKTTVLVPLLGGKRLQNALINSSTSRLILSIAELTFASIVFAIGTSVKKETLLLRDFGIILVGRALAKVGSELWSKKVGDKLIAANQQTTRDNTFYPTEVKVHRVVSQIFQSVAHFLPGALLAVANGAAFAGYSPAVGAVCYALTGILMGGKRHLERLRFTETPIGDLKELNYTSETKNTSERVFKYSKWAFSIVGVGGFLVLGMAGLNAQTGRFVHVPTIDPLVLGVFGLALYGSYSLGEFVKRKFKPENNSKLWNTLFFYLHYSQGFPLLAIFIMGKMQIGDKALSNNSFFANLMACAAYASLGTGIGLEANTRGVFHKPREPSALTMALIGNFIAAWLTGQFGQD